METPPHLNITTKIRDIDERETINTSPELQNALLESVYQNIPDATLITDTSDIIIMTNKACHNIFGYQENELVGKPIEHLFSNSHARENDIIQKARSTKEVLPALSYNIRYITRSGKVFCGETRHSEFFDKEGKLFGHIYLIKDVTAQLRSEEAHRNNEHHFTLSQTFANIGSWDWNFVSGAVTWSPATWSILNIDSTQATSSIATLFEYTHPDDRTILDKALLDCIGYGTEIDVDLRIQRTNTEFRWIKLRGAALRSKTSGPLHLSGVVIDIQNLKENEIQQTILRKQLQQAQKMEAIGQLTGGIAHDFNNMLASILGYTELALMKLSPDKDEKLQTYLNEVHHASVRARDLVKQMLTFSRTSKGEFKTISIPPILKEMQSMLRPLLPSTIDFELLTENENLKIKGDPVQLHQILMNLCINARDAMGEHGLLTIKIKPTDLSHAICSSCHQNFSGHYIEIAVSDTGDGIDEEIINHIFEPFVTTKEIGKGTGMGLPMVHGMLHEHKGHVILETKHKQGTTFRLLLPQSEDVAHSTTSDTYTPSPVSDNRHTSHTILIVDDEKAVGLFLSEILKNEGYQVQTYSSSTEALTHFKANPDQYAVVVTDQTMPRMTGFEMAKAMLEIRKDIPIVLCTGYSDSVNEDSAKQAGIAAFMEKPIDTSHFIKVVESCCLSNSQRIIGINTGLKR